VHVRSGAEKGCLIVMTTIAIMQPTFLPWLGYFDLIDQVDYFVYLDTVEFSKQSWQQRNRIKTSAGATWLTLPVEYSKTNKTTIAEAKIGNLNKFLPKSVNTLKHAYARSRYADDHQWILDYLLGLQEGESLASANIHFIERACSKAAINTPRYLASEIHHSSNRYQRLIDICNHFRADTYLSPMGAIAYLVEDIAHFELANINVCFHRYNPSIYRQMHGEFISHLSIVDSFMNEGNMTAEIIKQGRLEPLEFDQALIELG
jgi:hypothetical protein